jgi:clan AA aspartic protease
MMTGIVTGALEATIRRAVHDALGQVHEIDAVIDSGFNGCLLLPSASVTALALPWVCSVQAQLGDGSFQMFDVYALTIIWDNQSRVVEVEAGEGEPLLGMELMRGYSLRADIVPAGIVTLTAIP